MHIGDPDQRAGDLDVNLRRMAVARRCAVVGRDANRLHTLEPRSVKQLTLLLSLTNSPKVSYAEIECAGSKPTRHNPNERAKIMGKALEGVRVLDMTHVQSGPTS